jgi:hypothetical protein
VRKAAGALSFALLAPAPQPLSLVTTNDGLNASLLSLSIDAC